MKSILMSIKPKWVAKGYSVYKHTFPNSKIYIGITSQKPYLRFDNGNGYKTNPMKRAIKKYGWENVKHEILFENLTKEQAEQKEVELIKQFNSNNIKFGYNVAKGGHSNNGYKHTERTKEKMSEWHKGKKFSKETKEKMSKWQIQKNNLKNKKFGRLRALYPLHINNKLFWHCICDCGNETDVRPDHLKLEKVKSCGCLKIEKSTERIRRVNNEKHTYIN